MTLTETVLSSRVEFGMFDFAHCFCIFTERRGRPDRTHRPARRGHSHNRPLALTARHVYTPDDTRDSRLPSVPCAERHPIEDRHDKRSHKLRTRYRTSAERNTLTGRERSSAIPRGEMPTGGCTSNERNERTGVALYPVGATPTGGSGSEDYGTKVNISHVIRRGRS